ncbi:cytochrome P450 [Nemania sp. NC0429]|nr:cytochrome P450 [Nemania sp. NC0429]
MFSLLSLSGRSSFTDVQVEQCMFIVIGLITVTLAHAIWDKYSRKPPPVINPPGLFDFTGMSRKRDFLEQSYDLIHGTTRGSSSRPFSVYSDFGPIMLLPTTFVDEIKNHPKLSLLKLIEEKFQGSHPGLEPYKADLGVGIMRQIAKKQLTKFLNRVTLPLSLEASFAIQTILGDSSEWKELNLKSMNLALVCQLSSRVFLGELLCRNEDWLQTTSEYPVNALLAASQLRIYPKLLRPIVHWFLPECKLLRRQAAKARSIIQPVISQRQLERRKALEEGRPVPEYDDAINWAEEESKQYKYEPATLQLSLAGASIHTTADLLSKTILELLAHPELIQALRNEAIEVLRVHGWTKTGLYNLKLMDSVLKETQRVQPLGMVVMQRRADADVYLSDGTIIPKGVKCAVPNTSRLDSGVYENPDKFDGYRFLKMRRNPGREKSAQLVTTSVESLGFGHGIHACPGRFLAADEIKIALCHLLLKYDLKLSRDISPKVAWIGLALEVNPDITISLRRRKEEIDVDSP